ncbi:hypothetical protein B9Z19DRAFT_1078071 [Tuber borchii]|uniref:Uncharacterized protein n=1 Tax=Tuber borchii TaxID=42251 RepID=A0A2T6ZZW5_TUBBO|nr:hypothetical protein B9Z19DRAFT_1078071 [Tuber borchii]
MHGTLFSWQSALVTVQTSLTINWSIISNSCTRGCGGRSLSFLLFLVLYHPSSSLLLPLPYLFIS